MTSYGWSISSTTSTWTQVIEHRTHVVNKYEHAFFVAGVLDQIAHAAEAVPWRPWHSKDDGTGRIWMGKQTDTLAGDIMHASLFVGETIADAECRLLWQ